MGLPKKQRIETKKNKVKEQSDNSIAVSHSFIDGKTAHTIRFGGLATKYSTSDTDAAIQFYSKTFVNETEADRLDVSDSNAKKVVSISGSLGSIFPTLEKAQNGQKQPRFLNTLRGTLITSVPEGLFNGVYGEPTNWMFGYTFAGTNIKSIPKGLFSGLRGKTAPNIFYRTFMKCANIESIPEELFCKEPYMPDSTNCIYGIPASNMFQATFRECTSLTKIPEKLFAGINGQPEGGVFNQTFEGCKNLTEIPEDLFDGIEGTPTNSMFARTFESCKKLAKITRDNVSTSYVPESFLGAIKDGTAKEPVLNMFADTQLDTTCPAGTTDVTRELFKFAGKPWCSGVPSIQVPVGKYLPANTTVLADCKGDKKYCPGGTFDMTSRDQGIFDCPLNGRANTEHTACNISLSITQMQFGSKGKDSALPCWSMSDSEDYKNCILGK